MITYKLNDGYSLVDSGESIFFLPLLTEEKVNAQIPYICSTTGIRIVRLLQRGLESDEEIIDSLFQEYDVDMQTLTEDVMEFLDSLQEMGVIKRE